MEIKLTPAMEDYIESIYLLEKKNKVARVSDIGKKMDVKKASVVSAVSQLGKLELLKHERYGYITLTDAGKKLAEGIYKKHTVIYDFLTAVLKIDEETARKEACSIEHALSEDTVSRLISFVKSAKKDKAKRVSAKKPKKKRTKPKKKKRR